MDFWKMKEVDQKEERKQEENIDNKKKHVL